MIIRQEVISDYEPVFNLIEEAFRTEAYSDHREHYLVERLRASDAFIPELSLVAEIEGKIVGHILLTKVIIQNGAKAHDVLALAPVSVLPAFQNKGIGGELIRASHKKAQALGYKGIVLIGHEDYYPRFGYKQASEFGIEFPFEEVPKENCMALELEENALRNVEGLVVYPKAFFE